MLSREEPETFHFLAARDNVPLKSEFKPALKVLSRKPAPKVIQRIDPVTGLAKMSLEEEEDEDEQKKDQPSPEELRLRAQREREEKQKRYDEARARILGTTSGTSSPGTTTPPTEETKSNRSRGRGRGNGRHENPRPGSQSSNKELFDPNYTPKPGVTIQKRNGEGSRSGQSTPRDEDQVIRAPRCPDASGKGFGFANRGGKAS
jgi:cobalamin biosynthesis Mg chelatase CobN